jgi:hypothetical protein
MYSRKVDWKFSGRMRELGMNFKASALGVSSVWMKIERVPAGNRELTGLSEGALGRCLVAVDVRVEGVDKRCRLLRIGAVAIVLDALERATFLQVDVNIVDLAGMMGREVNILGMAKERSGCSYVQKINDYLTLE